MDIKAVLLDFVNWNNENHTDYIPNSRIGRYLQETGKAETSNDAPAGGLSKHDVNQQRELLAAFKEDYNKRNFEDAQIIDQDIELFLAANSG